MRKGLLTLILSLGIWQYAWADNVTYIERSWDEESKAVKAVTKTANATKVTTSNPTLQSGWYYVEGELTLGTLTIEGMDVHLILTDGCQLNCHNIKLERRSYQDLGDRIHNRTLYVYSQSDDNARQGHVTVNSTSEGVAGIGSTAESLMGHLVVHGGVFAVQGAKRAAGIGAGWEGSYKSTWEQRVHSGVMIVYGGSITAIGGEGGAGIGGGCGYEDKGLRGLEYTQYGGWVTATGGELAAGLGGGGCYKWIEANVKGVGGSLGRTHIYGGVLSATGGHRAAGIGSGSCPPNAYESHYEELRINSCQSDAEHPEKYTVIIEGGTVTAKGGSYGAGIGGGCNVQGATTYIYGGEVVAFGGKDAAGIGGGEDGPGQWCCITGGTVKAYGGGYGAGIGGGDNCMGGGIKLLGGTIEAKAGDKCKGTDSKCGSAIGSGDGERNKDNCAGNTLTLGETMKVSAGSSENAIEKTFTNPERIDACHWHQYARVEACNHQEGTYRVVGENTHKFTCRFCALDKEEDHLVENCPCGYTMGTWTITYHRPDSKAVIFYDASQDITEKVGKGRAAQLIDCENLEALEFIGWQIEPAEVPALTYSIEDDSNLLDAGDDYTPTKDVHAYARYRIVYDEKWTWADDKQSCRLELTDRLLHQTVTYDASVRTEVIAPTPYEKGYTLYIAEYVLNGYHYIDFIYDWKNYTLEIKDDEDNSNVVIQTLIGGEVDVKYDRVLSASKQSDGTWKSKAYTISLPYEVQLAETYTDQFMVYHLSNVDLEKRELTFTHDFPILKARQAYVIVVNEGTLSLDARNVTIYSLYSGGDEVFNADGSAVLGWWRPMTSEKTAAELAKDHAYLLRSDGSFTRVNATDQESLRAYRAYFSLTADTDIQSFKTRFVIISDGEDDDQVVDIDFFDDDTTTAIRDIPAADVSSGRATGDCYDLQGRLITGTPTRPGVYIRNGKKFFLK